MTSPDQGQPLPLDLVSTKDLVEEMQRRFDVFAAAGIKVKQAEELSFQFCTRGNLFDVIAMLEYLKVELVIKQVEKKNGNGNSTTSFD